MACYFFLTEHRTVKERMQSELDQLIVSFENVFFELLDMIVLMRNLALNLKMECHSALKSLLYRIESLQVFL